MVHPVQVRSFYTAEDLVKKRKDLIRRYARFHKSAEGGAIARHHVKGDAPCFNLGDARPQNTDNIVMYRSLFEKRLRFTRSVARKHLTANSFPSSSSTRYTVPDPPSPRGRLTVYLFVAVSKTLGVFGML
jgi:hypothetical protein